MGQHMNNTVLKRGAVRYPAYPLYQLNSCCSCFCSLSYSGGHAAVDSMLIAADNLESGVLYL